MCAVSRNATFLADRRRSSLDSDQRVGRDRSKGYKQPGMDFLCPPVLHDLLTRHWGEMQDGFSDADDLNKVLDFQSEELLWTAQKRGEIRKIGRRHKNVCLGGKRVSVVVFEAACV